ncbi:4-coumarate--CoA ligase 2 [Fusarium oxysporum f. sp. albedinis]|nr:4-coumarate--CoA ligase 2 [Fusarium oxysporum f. sp. albedinis]
MNTMRTSNQFSVDNQPYDKVIKANYRKESATLTGCDISEFRDIALKIYIPKMCLNIDNKEGGYRLNTNANVLARSVRKPGRDNTSIYCLGLWNHALQAGVLKR